MSSSCDALRTRIQRDIRHRHIEKSRDIVSHFLKISPNPPSGADAFCRIHHIDRNSRVRLLFLYIFLFNCNKVKLWQKHIYKNVQRKLGFILYHREMKSLHCKLLKSVRRDLVSE